MSQDDKKLEVERAVALGYDIKQDEAPRILATGSGDIAKKIIELAKENNIPLYKDPDLIEVLRKVEVGELIPTEVFFVIAEILAFVYKANQKYKEEL